MHREWNGGTVFGRPQTGDYTEIDYHGRLIFRGHATMFGDTLQTSTQAKVGANLLPEFDQTEIGFSFPDSTVGGGQAAQKLFFSLQFSHSYKEGTDLHPHVHWVQTNSETPIWKISYRWYNNGETIPSFQVIETTGLVFEYTSGNVLQISTFPAIDGSDKKISSILDFSLYREDALTDGPRIMKSMDFHYEIDGFGSDQEYYKTFNPPYYP